MKSRFSILCLFAAAISLNYVSACPDSMYEVQLKQLTDLTPKVLEENPSEELLGQFFNSMPLTFDCFNRLFGYGDEPAPLYSEPQLHFLFPKIENAVSAEKYAEKILGLSVNAIWEADQTGALQKAVRSILDNKTELFLTKLELYPTESQESVWKFIFGGPHPSNSPISADVRNVICRVSATNCVLVKQVYEKKVAEEHRH